MTPPKETTIIQPAPRQVKCFIHEIREEGCVDCRSETQPAPVEQDVERLWHCNCCRTEFQHVGNHRPNCPTCKAWDQYTYQGPVTPLQKDNARRVPTAAEVNALPDHIRNYIAWIETEADPSGSLRSDMYLRCELVPAMEAALSTLTPARAEGFKADDLTHRQWQALSRKFNESADLAFAEYRIINEWLKRRIAEAAND